MTTAIENISQNLVFVDWQKAKQTTVKLCFAFPYYVTFGLRDSF